MHMMMTYSTATHVSNSAIEMHIELQSIQSYLRVIYSASVKFNFDICSLKNDLINSVKAFEIGDKLGFIVDHYVAPRIDRAIFEGNLYVVDKIKTYLQGHAKTEANKIKSDIAEQISAISCNSRLEEVEVDGDGSQRLLFQDSSFDYLVDQIHKIFIRSPIMVSDSHI